MSKIKNKELELKKKLKPLVAIVIVNWNKKELTGNCLKTLKMTTYPNYKVILVDNGSNDGSNEYLKKINPNIDIIKLDKNYGYTIGTNVGWKYGIEELNADYICAMDNDIITIQKEWLDLIIDELQKYPTRGIGSGKHLFPDGRLQTPYIGADKTYQMDTGKYDFIKEVPAFVGPAILIKKAVIKKIGFYDENFFYGPNDIDYCYRAEKAGYRLVYNGLSRSVHIGSASGRSPAKDLIYRHQSEGMMIFSFRYGKIGEKLHMASRQFIRAFVTRIDPVAPMKFKNLLFHGNFIQRLGIYFVALSKAIRNYNRVQYSSDKVLRQASISKSSN